MKNNITILVISLFIITKLNAQNIESYNLEIKIADTFFFHQDYSKSIIHYNNAIIKNENKGKVVHRYRLASCYALENDLENAFKELFYISEKGNFKQVELIEKDRNFNNLHNDERWIKLIKRVKLNL